MIPNHVLFYSFGKVLFSICDVLCGIVVYQIFKNEGIDSRNNLRFASLWIFNPYVIYLSTRGSADSLECLFVFLTLLLIQNSKIGLSAFIFGLSVHFKISFRSFPVTRSTTITMTATRRMMLRAISYWKLLI